MLERPKSFAEFEALPIGPAFGQRTEGGVTVPIMPEVVAFYSGDSELISMTNEDGNWALGRYADGSWFRQRK